MELYGLANCDTCRKAAKALGNLAVVDVRKEPLQDALLQQALAAFPDTLINTRSTTWRTLDVTERAQDPLHLLRAHPALMKRPLIVEGETMTLGWTKEVQARWLS